MSCIFDVMGKGAQIFSSLFQDEPTPKVETKERKGRSDDLISKRNQELMLRYIYYGVYTDKRNDKILQELESEFYIAQRTIYDIIQSNYEQLRELRANVPTVKDLREMYPHKVW